MEVKETTTCKCKGKCQNNRCVCKKNRQPCSKECKCKDCQNPYNGVKVEELHICTLDNIETYKKASKENLAKVLGKLNGDKVYNGLHTKGDI